MSSGYGQGYIADSFMTPEGVEFQLVIDEGNKRHEAVSSEMWCTARPTAFDAPDDALASDPAAQGYVSMLNENHLGRQMLITVLHVRDPKDLRFIAYRVQLDPDPSAPRYTKILPRQEITGKIWCPRNHAETTDDAVYLVTEQNERHKLVAASPHEKIRDWCDVQGTVTLHGDRLLWTEERLFRTRDVPTFP